MGEVNLWAGWPTALRRESSSGGSGTSAGSDGGLGVAVDSGGSRGGAASVRLCHGGRLQPERTTGNASEPLCAGVHPCVHGGRDDADA